MRSLLIPLALMSLACAGVGSLFESAQMKRAKEFISVSEFESARNELRVQLHNKPEDSEAKSLLLFMRLTEMGNDAAVGCLVPATAQKATSTAAEEAQKALRLSLRKTELDAGIPTKDWDEYRAVLDRAVTYGWVEHDFPSDNIGPKLVFAFCAAARGDATGTAYLVDHLAQDDVREKAESLLYLIGDSAIPSLSAVSKSPENLAQASAEQALRNLQLALIIEKLSAQHSKRVSPTTARTDGKTRGQSSGKYLMGLGWRDDNEGLKPVFDAAAVRASLNQVPGADEAAPIMIRRAKLGESEVVVATVALPASSNTEDAALPLQPAGINTTFLSQAWSWSVDRWAPVTIDGKPSISGPDLAVLAVTGPPVAGAETPSTLGPDQLAMDVYRGVQERKEMVNYGWYGMRERTTRGARIDTFVYHLGAGALERVKTTNREGLEIDAHGVPLPGQEDIGLEIEGEEDED